MKARNQPKWLGRRGQSARGVVDQMSDIQNHRVLWLKFGFFIVLGLLAFGIILALFPSFQLAGLMIIAIWAFCRAYYFAFYVIQHYIDPSYRFAGLSSFVRYVLRNRSDTDSSAW
jgi:hypothetical protein